MCLVTHVLLPVTVLARRAYAVGVIGAALLARAGGSGHRTIGRDLGVPAATVRGWLRVMGSRLEATRLQLLAVAHRAGGDRPVPRALGSPWRDVLAALGAATAAVTGRFGGFGVLAPGDALAGRRGLFGWSAVVPGVAAAVARGRCQHELPLTRRGAARNPHQGPPAGPGAGVSREEQGFSW